MDPVKLIVFVGAFLLLLVLGRKLSSSSETGFPRGQLPTPPEPIPLPVQASGEETADDHDTRRTPAAIGADLPFPVSLPPVMRDEYGRYNRPNFLNYHFRKIDLINGPTDKKCFCDDLVVETEDPDDGRYLNYTYTIATPAGLQKVMEADHLVSLDLDVETIIVTEWDLKMIVATVVKKIMKIYQEPVERSEENGLANEKL